MPRDKLTFPAAVLINSPRVRYQLAGISRLNVCVMRTERRTLLKGGKGASRGPRARETLAQPARRDNKRALLCCVVCSAAACRQSVLDRRLLRAHVANKFRCRVSADTTDTTPARGGSVNSRACVSPPRRPVVQHPETVCISHLDYAILG